MKVFYQDTACFLLVICLTSLSCFGQWAHDFSTDDLSDWIGDVENFMVNDSDQLQLNATDAGESYIYRSSVIDFDTVTFEMFHLLDFAPSANNLSRIYLALSSEDLTIASGYFMEIGENGSEDAINFYYLNGGIESFIASASMGALATEPAIVRLQIDIFPDGLWTVKTNYSGDEFTALELEFIDDQFELKESNFFGLSCKYSASRSDKFFYDDISIQKYERDLTLPVVTDVTTLNSNGLIVTYSEPVIESQATNTSNYSLNNGAGNPTTITRLGALGNQYQLTFSNEFDATNDYILTVTGVSDLNENMIEDQMIGFLFAGQPEVGDLFISEILFDPYPEGEDFVEIYNKSNKALELLGMAILNNQNEASEIINTSIILPAKGYIAMTEDEDFLFQEYKPEAGAIIELQELPAFNNDEGNVMLVGIDGIVLDSFDYNEDQHFQLIDDTEGVSLERVSFEVEAGNERNWQSASKSVRFSTPGYKNSSSVPTSSGNENFELVKEIFSPNQDGEDDQMIMNYSLEKSGYLANITIHDAAGFKIKELSNNELLGVEGIITWDGVGDDNQIADLGIYIIVGNIFHTDGDVLNFKLTTVLADRF